MAFIFPSNHYACPARQEVAGLLPLSDAQWINSLFFYAYTRSFAASYWPSSQLLLFWFSPASHYVRRLNQRLGRCLVAGWGQPTTPSHTQIHCFRNYTPCVSSYIWEFWIKTDCDISVHSHLTYSFQFKEHGWWYNLESEKLDKCLKKPWSIYTTCSQLLNKSQQCKVIIPNNWLTKLRKIV